jgi:hypothetical protein
MADGGWWKKGKLWRGGEGDEGRGEEREVEFAPVGELW